MLFGKKVWESLSVYLSGSQLRIFDELEVFGAEGMGDVVRSRQHVGVSEPRLSPALLCKQPSLTAAELGRLPACYTFISISGLSSPLFTSSIRWRIQKHNSPLCGFLLAQSHLPIDQMHYLSPLFQE